MTVQLIMQSSRKLTKEKVPARTCLRIIDYPNVVFRPARIIRRCGRPAANEASMTAIAANEKNFLHFI